MQPTGGSWSSLSNTFSSRSRSASNTAGFHLGVDAAAGPGGKKAGHRGKAEFLKEEEEELISIHAYS